MELRVIYECEFVEIKNNNPEICHGVDEMLSSFRLASPHIKKISSEILLKAVESAELSCKHPMPAEKESDTQQKRSLEKLPRS